MGRALVALGLLLVLAGLAWQGLDRLGIGLGRLPGDLSWKGERFEMHLPLATCVLISLGGTAALWLYRRFFG